jgi:hypothetical protein
MSRSRRKQEPVTALEIVCVLLVLLSIAGLVAWIITQAGGGHFVF